jgi:hypothetical protein
MYAPNKKATAATVAHIGALQRSLSYQDSSTKVLFPQDQSTKNHHNPINSTACFRKTEAANTQGGQRY